MVVYLSDIFSLKIMQLMASQIFGKHFVGHHVQIAIGVRTLEL
jgi:hypothetical protein